MQGARLLEDPSDRPVVLPLGAGRQSPPLEALARLCAEPLAAAPPPLRAWALPDFAPLPALTLPRCGEQMHQHGAATPSRDRGGW